MNALVIPFDELTEAMLTPQFIGGKAVSLARLHRAEFLVPPGFVITSSFFTLGDTFSDDAISPIHALFYTHCPSGFAAVRSSAAVEDSLTHSFAGQFESYLNVTKDDLINTIQECSQSRHNQRVASYAKEKDFPMAVIVQDMIHPSLSGVAFSMNPVTRNTTQLVIEAVHGHNEALVQGSVTPDHYEINEQDVVVESYASFGQPVLSSAMIAHIANTTRKVRALFGQEVDIEWAVAHDRLYILQSRPISST